jgi:hypothetical protein
MSTKPQLLKKLSFLSPADRVLPISAQGKLEAERVRRAVELGPIELMSLIEWELRSRPRALRNARRKYRDFCVALYRRPEKARGGR